MTYLVLIALGGVCLSIGWAAADEIYRIGALIAGTFLCLWGVAIAPLLLQLLLEVLLVVAVFSICLRCLEKGSLKRR